MWFLKNITPPPQYTPEEMLLILVGLWGVYFFTRIVGDSLDGLWNIVQILTRPTH